MGTLTMLDRGQAPPAATAVKALALASQAAGTPAPGAWAFYLGGPGHNRGRGSTYTNALLDELQKRRIALLPIYVGRQRDLSRARGVKDAKEALALNKAFGNRNSIIAADIERHTSDADPSAAVEYCNGWTETLHAAGLRSLVYGSSDLAADLAKRAKPQPDAVWVARYRTHKPDPTRDPHDIPGVPATAFAKAGQRAWQYGAEFKDKPTDAKPKPCDIEGINVDISSVDAELLGPVPKPVKAAAASPPRVIKAPAAGTRVIVPGDTLSALEKELGLKRGSLFVTNRAVLDADARKHGLPDSHQGDKIFPGTTITIPR
jgi:hypothetical protein